MHQQVAGSIPDQGTCPCCRLDSPAGEPARLAQAVESTAGTKPRKHLEAEFNLYIYLIVLWILHGNRIKLTYIVSIFFKCLTEIQ